MPYVTVSVPASVPGSMPASVIVPRLPAMARLSLTDDDNGKLTLNGDVTLNEVSVRFGVLHVAKVVRLNCAPVPAPPVTDAGLVGSTVYCPMFGMMNPVIEPPAPIEVTVRR